MYSLWWCTALALVAVAGFRFADPEENVAMEGQMTDSMKMPNQIDEVRRSCASATSSAAAKLLKVILQYGDSAHRLVRRNRQSDVGTKETTTVLPVGFPML